MLFKKRKLYVVTLFISIFLVRSVYAEPHLENLILLESEETKGNSYQPVFSSNGKKLSFEKISRESEQKQLFLVNLTKTPPEIKEINPVKTDSAFFFKKSSPKRNVYDLSWAPNGLKYSYTSSTGIENQDIFISGVGRVTEDPKADGQPAWSPDDKNIAFVSSRAGKADIFIFDPYALELDNLGKNKIRLTNDPVSSSLFPSWSPNGKKIAYVSHFEANDDIYVLDKLDNPSRKHHRRITKEESSDINPSWSPDGKMLAFYSDNNHPKIFGIFIVSADGSSPAVEIATEVVKNDRHGPAWSADGKSIVYVENNTETFNPLILVETTEPYKKSQINSNTQMNGDVNLLFSEGKTKIAFTAQGRNGDREKRWMRIYVADLVY